jgi:hypothetical protein
VLPVQLRRFRGREVHGHDHEAAGQARQRGSVGGSAQVELDAPEHVVEVGRALLEVRVAQSLEALVQLVGHRAQRPLRVHQLLADDADGGIEEQGVLQHQQVGVEDVGVDADLVAQALLDGLELLARGFHGTGQALDLAVHRLRGDEEAEDGHRLPLHHQRGADGQAGRDADPIQLHASSPKPPSTSAARASTAGASSSPSALTVRRVPWEAASRRMPRIDLPSSARCG